MRGWVAITPLHQPPNHTHTHDVHKRGGLLRAPVASTTMHNCLGKQSLLGPSCGGGGRTVAESGVPPVGTAASAAATARTGSSVLLSGSGHLQATAGLQLAGPAGAALCVVSAVAPCGVLQCCRCVRCLLLGRGHALPPVQARALHRRGAASSGSTCLPTYVAGPVPAIHCIACSSSSPAHTTVACISGGLCWPPAVALLDPAAPLMLLCVAALVLHAVAPAPACSGDAC